ncbi:MAG: PhzF family phenazine biosynthesis protein [Hyphococcus sp.]
MPQLPFETYDVFTDRRFSGNQLAVIVDAGALTSDDMQAITREFNLAETSFILPPDDPTHHARVRIFTPGYEMPFAGHPTVGTAVAIARAHGLSGSIALELNAGLFQVRVETNAEGGWAEFLNPNLPAETGDAPAPEAIEQALSLPAGALDRGAFKPRRIGAGVDYIYARAALDVVRNAQLDSAAWQALQLDGIIGVYLYASLADHKDAQSVDYHARMFAPGAGVFEDAATGSAAAALPGHLVLGENLADGQHRFVIAQGVEMGRPSRIEARIETERGAVMAVRIGGAAVKVQEGRISV